MVALYDYARLERIGMPEAIFCQGKDTDTLNRLIGELSGRPDFPVLFTRLTNEQLVQIESSLSTRLAYDALSQTAYLNGSLPQRPGRVSVITAGSSDLRVARETIRTLEFMGIAAELHSDVGVAGIWRLLERIEQIKLADVLIVIAGMDAALASVVGGLTGKPIIGVPTSVGYGVATGGGTALNSMLASCAQGVLVTNIDNGFGAACAAGRILLPNQPIGER